jgi:mannose-6-phosphate isomerase-like protein (cupin superfamily)
MSDAPSTKPTDTRTSLFGGAGEVHVVDLLAGADAGHVRALLRCRLDPAGSIGPHLQQAEDSLFVHLGGRGHAVVDGERHPFGADDFVQHPLGRTLSLHNDSATEALDYLIIKTPQP